jgi:hypothetical protein
VLHGMVQPDRGAWRAAAVCSVQCATAAARLVGGNRWLISLSMQHCRATLQGRQLAGVRYGMQLVQSSKGAVHQHIDGAVQQSAGGCGVTRTHRAGSYLEGALQQPRVGVHGAVGFIDPHHAIVTRAGHHQPQLLRCEGYAPATWRVAGGWAVVCDNACGK